MSARALLTVALGILAAGYDDEEDLDAALDAPWPFTGQLAGLGFPAGTMEPPADLAVEAGQRDREQQRKRAAAVLAAGGEILG